MAEHANSTPAPIVDLCTPRKQVEDALYEVGIIADIVEKLANFDDQHKRASLRHIF